MYNHQEYSKLFATFTFIDSRFNIYIYILTNNRLHNYNESYRGIPKSHQGNLMIGGPRMK